MILILLLFLLLLLIDNEPSPLFYNKLYNIMSWLQSVERLSSVCSVSPPQLHGAAAFKPN